MRGRKTTSFRDEHTRLKWLVLRRRYPPVEQHGHSSIRKATISAGEAVILRAFDPEGPLDLDELRFYVETHVQRPGASFLHSHRVEGLEWEALLHLANVQLGCDVSLAFEALVWLYPLDRPPYTPEDQERVRVHLREWIREQRLKHPAPKWVRARRKKGRTDPFRRNPLAHLHTFEDPWREKIRMVVDIRGHPTRSMANTIKSLYRCSYSDLFRVVMLLTLKDPPPVCLEGFGLVADAYTYKVHTNLRLPAAEFALWWMLADRYHSSDLSSALEWAILHHYQQVPLYLPVTSRAFVELQAQGEKVLDALQPKD